MWNDVWRSAGKNSPSLPEWKEIGCALVQNHRGDTNNSREELNGWRRYHLKKLLCAELWDFSSPSRCFHPLRAQFCSPGGLTSILKLYFSSVHFPRVLCEISVWEVLCYEGDAGNGCGVDEVSGKLWYLFSETNYRPHCKSPTLWSIKTWFVPTLKIVGDSAVSYSLLSVKVRS